MGGRKTSTRNYRWGKKELTGLGIRNREKEGEGTGKKPPGGKGGGTGSVAAAPVR